MVGLVILTIIWFISGILNAIFLAVYEIVILHDWDLNSKRFSLVLIPIVNTIYLVYIIRKLYF